MKRVHFVDNYLLNPLHPVTIHLIGAGGTGSQVLTCLARLDVTLKALNHPGLFVTVYDPDMVAESNLGRQLFGYSDLGLNKAVCLLSRINLFFGNDWKAEPRAYPANAINVDRVDLANITITCTDNVKSRVNLSNLFSQVPERSYRDYQTPLYWMDFGNTQTSGQVIIGSVSEQIKQPKSKVYETIGALKTVTQYVNYNNLKDEDSEIGRAHV